MIGQGEASHKCIRWSNHIIWYFDFAIDGARWLNDQIIYHQINWSINLIKTQRPHHKDSFITKGILVSSKLTSSRVRFDLFGLLIWIYYQKHLPKDFPDNFIREIKPSILYTTLPLWHWWQCMMWKQYINVLSKKLQPSHFKIFIQNTTFTNNRMTEFSFKLSWRKFLQPNL